MKRVCDLSDPQWLIPHVRMTDSGCWLWLHAKSDKGYGHIRVDGRETYVHRLSYEHYVGPIPEGLQIDHLCRAPACCNPAHLEAVTQRENILRGNATSAIHSRQTHCIHGHPLSGDNLYVPPRGGRQCRRCQAERNRKGMARRRAQARA